MRLRSGVQAALAYVLLLAIIALGIPLALSLKTRVNDEVRSQAQGQADLVAATAADLLGPSHRNELATVARTAAAAVRGRVLIVNAAGTVIADSAGSGELGTSYAQRPEIRSALHGSSVQLQRASRTLGRGDPRDRVTGDPQPRDGRRCPDHAERRIRALGDQPRRARAGADRRRRAGARSARRERDRRADRAPPRTARAGRQQRRPRRPRGARSRGGLPRAAIARRLVQRDDGSDPAPARLAAGVRRRRLPSAANPADRRCACAWKRRPPPGVSPAARSEIEAGVGEVDRLAEIIEELLVLSRAGEREMPGERLDLEPLVAEALARWRPAAAEREIRLEGPPSSRVPAGPAGTGTSPRPPPSRCGVPGPTQSGSSTRCSRTRSPTARGARASRSTSDDGAVEIRDGGPGLIDEDLDERLRALPPRQRGPRRRARQRARALDRTGAGARTGVVR